MKAATIKLFLVTGSPNGLRTAELSNWSGKAIAAPRNVLPALLDRHELSNPGVYFLTGTDPESGDPTVYIGEAEDVGARLKNHTGKDFWNAVTTFVSKDENLTKSHIRYLEGKLIELGNEQSSWLVLNSASSGAKLPESDAAEMDSFLEKMLQLLPVLGVSTFSNPTESPSNPEEVLICKIKGILARGKRTSGGFTVFAGSQAVLEHRPSAGSIKNKRESLISKGILKAGSNALLFTKDTEFSSPSMAASVVRGGPSNGLTLWKSSAGQSLKEIEENET